MKLYELKLGQVAIIKKVNFGDSTLRIMELGMVSGSQIMLKSVAPTGDPMAFEIGDSILSLRKKDAALVEIDIVL